MHSFLKPCGGLSGLNVSVLPPLVVSFWDWMPYWILEWMGGNRSAA